MGKSKLVLITNPDDKKNLDIDKQLDRFMEKEINNLKKKNNQIIASVLPGVNESTKFIVPKKLPSLLFYKKGAALNEKPVEIDKLEILKIFKINKKD